MNDRIKLAEAMGWIKVGPLSGDYSGNPPGTSGWPSPIPDPFTNANDDYAVLEWMRKDGPNEAMDHFLFWHPQDYQVGDYARAALKVLENKDE